MLASLDRLAALPGETQVYCAHEYTLDNLRFAREAEPGNIALLKRDAAERAKRSQGQITLPTTIARERSTNPFLRVRERGVIDALLRRGLVWPAEPLPCFSALRAWKDQYR